MNNGSTSLRWSLSFLWNSHKHKKSEQIDFLLSVVALLHAAITLFADIKLSVDVKWPLRATCGTALITWER